MPTADTTTVGGCPSKRRPTSRSVTEAVTSREPDTRRLPLSRTSNVLAVDPHRGHGCRSLGATLAASSNWSPQLPQATSDIRAILVVHLDSLELRKVLDDLSQRRYCRIIFAGCSSQPPPHRSMWSMFESAVSGHGSFATSQPLPGRLFVRRHVRETDDPNGLRFGPRPSADPTVHHRSKPSPCHGGTPVRSRCVGRCVQRAHSP